MPFSHHAGLRYFQFESFQFDWLDHGVFTRQGGVSQGHLASLNVGANVGDNPSNILENKNRIYQAMDRDPGSSFDLWQVHSADVLVANGPRQGEPYPKADGVVSTSKDVTLSMRFADCVPIMLVDPDKKVIAMVHAGWKGTVRGTAQAAVTKLVETFKSEPDKLIAGIGPAIRRHHYPVGIEVIKAFRQSYGAGADDFIEQAGGQFHLDLAGANRSVLESMGISNIEDCGLCTACDLEDWYSHRGQDGQAGRFAGMMGIR